MRIGILGAGVAGLTAAWLLGDEHDVTLFEKQDRLGGHAHTIDVTLAGERVAVDAGAEFFSAAMFPTFLRLLNLLGVPLHQYPISATLYTVDNRYVALLPPLRDGRVIWPALGPRQIADMAQFGYVLLQARRLMQAPEPGITLEQFLNRLPLTRAFKQRFMYPFVLAGWCVEPDAFRHFSAYDVLKYYYLHGTAGLSPAIITDVVGGTRTYVTALAGRLGRATVMTSTSIRCLRRSGSTFLLQSEAGDQYEFDCLILATNARDARQLLVEVEGTKAVRQLLGQIEYFTTTIAVHGDARLMPANRQHWSVVNTRYDGHYSANTIWKGWKSREPIFKSWVTYEARLPEPLYGLATYDHPTVNASYFAAQKELARWQGHNQIWLAGMHMHDVDCHESATLSAVNVARKLAPNAARLKQLAGVR
jgi:predicted NAD/FAD-binding protein